MDPWLDGSNHHQSLYIFVFVTLVHIFYYCIMLLIFFRFQLSSLEQQYVAESLQSSKAQSTRALTRSHTQQNPSTSPSNRQPSPTICSTATATLPSSETINSTTYTTTTTTHTTTTTTSLTTDSVTGKGGNVKRRHRLRMSPMANTGLSTSKAKHVS